MNKFLIAVVSVFIATAFLTCPDTADAYGTYTAGCDGCHGGFEDGVSTKGSVFPGDDKHQMHRSSNEMDADCFLCHIQIGDNPPLDESAGTANNVGYGCMGCHGRLEDSGNDGVSNGYGAGLRQHHNNAGLTICAVCHTDANPINYTPVGEHVKPPYYGTADTNVDMSCNPDLTGRTNENWTLTDFVGLDNDGDLFYDSVGDTDCAPVVVTPHDLDADGMADILWRNSSTGQNWSYFMNGSSISQSVAINTVSDSQWQIVGNGDYNGDGSADVLWRHSGDGRNWMYLMNGTTITSSVAVNVVSDQQWQVVGNGDFDGDGSSDILWRNGATGENWIYLMNGASIASSVGLNVVSDLQWSIVGNGDYNGDGNADILWRHSGDGRNWMYLMNGTSINSNVAVDIVDEQEWQVVGNGDYDGDGNSDILWRNGVTGQNWMYLMNGASIASNVSLNVVSDLQWMIVGDGDYNGDGNADILWRHTGDGRNWMYQMNGASISSSQGVNVVSGSLWQVVNTP